MRACSTGQTHRAPPPNNARRGDEVCAQCGGGASATSGRRADGTAAAQGECVRVYIISYLGILYMISLTVGCGETERLTVGPS